MNLLSSCKRMAEGLFGVRVFGYPPGIMQIIPAGKRKQAWFSRLLMLRSIIEEYQVDLVLDVGAHKGRFTRELRGFYRGRLFPSNR